MALLEGLQRLAQGPFAQKSIVRQSMASSPPTSPTYYVGRCISALIAFSMPVAQRGPASGFAGLKMAIRRTDMLENDSGRTTDIMTFNEFASNLCNTLRVNVLQPLAASREIDAMLASTISCDVSIMQHTCETGIVKRY